MLKGRIIKGVGGLYMVDTDNGTYKCQARGLFRKQNKTPLVGDFVDISIVDDEKNIGYLQSIYPRKNELIRPRSANIDQAIIVFAAVFPEINFDLLNRFIVVIEEQELDIVICINKIDLIDQSCYNEIIKRYTKIGYKIISVSALENIGIDEFRDVMKNKVSIVAGPSGVGKSSLINTAFSHLCLETGELSKKIERGKHTTRHTELLNLDSGGYIADTPGFTSLSLDKIDAYDMQFYFKEFIPFIGKCKFNNCKHINEPGCIIKEEVGKNICAERYKSYISFMKRS